MNSRNTVLSGEAGPQEHDTPLQTGLPPHEFSPQGAPPVVDSIHKVVRDFELSSTPESGHEELHHPDLHGGASLPPIVTHHIEQNAAPKVRPVSELQQSELQVTAERRQVDMGSGQVPDAKVSNAVAKDPPGRSSEVKAQRVARTASRRHIDRGVTSYRGVKRLLKLLGLLSPSSDPASLFTERHYNRSSLDRFISTLARRIAILRHELLRLLLPDSIYRPMIRRKKKRERARRQEALKKIKSPDAQQPPQQTAGPTIKSASSPKST